MFDKFTRIKPIIVKTQHLFCSIIYRTAATNEDFTKGLNKTISQVTQCNVDMGVDVYICRSNKITVNSYNLVDVGQSTL